MRKVRSRAVDVCHLVSSNVRKFASSCATTRRYFCEAKVRDLCLEVRSKQYVCTKHIQYIRYYNNHHRHHVYYHPMVGEIKQCCNPSVFPMHLDQQWCFYGCSCYRTLIGNPVIKVKHTAQHGKTAIKSG